MKPLSLECLLLASLVTLFGCARPSETPGATLAGAAAYRRAQGTLYARAELQRDTRPRRVLSHGSAPASQATFNQRSARARGGHGPGARSLAIPTGGRCLAWLDSHGIDFRPLKSRAGVKTPVLVSGPIGGVQYVTHAGPSLVSDCRLVVALHWIAPQLRALGVRRVRHSGAYVYRTTRKGRLSLHALGLAIDLHAFEVQGSMQDIKHDYVVGMRNACHPQAPTLNHLACRLDTTGLFKELITPDDDRDHHDHLHLAIAPL